MNEFYKFAGEHPVLTFFLMLIIGQVIVYIIHSIVKILKMCFLKVTLKK